MKPRPSFNTNDNCFSFFLFSIHLGKTWYKRINPNEHSKNLNVKSGTKYKKDQCWQQPPNQNRVQTSSQWRVHLHNYSLQNKIGCKQGIKENWPCGFLGKRVKTQQVLQLTHAPRWPSHHKIHTYKRSKRGHHHKLSREETTKWGLYD